MSGLVGYWKSLWRGAGTLVMTLRATIPYLVGASNSYKEMTEEYPDRVSARMPEDLPPRYRGFLQNDIQKCSGCRYCADVCPVECIHIETEPGPERNVSWVAVFDIDLARCMFCGLCVEICPTKSLRHTREYEGSVFRLEEMIRSNGHGWATAEMKQIWLSEQIARDAQAEEKAWSEQSPVSAELRRRQAKREEK
jgi:NAD(P)H-quinone oxidoreductase subunit I